MNLETFDNEDRPNYTELQDGIVKAISPPRIQTMLCGAWAACQDNTGTITLKYTDGSMETARADMDIDDFDNFFGIVGYVQSKRGNDMKGVKS